MRAPGLLLPLLLLGVSSQDPSAGLKGVGTTGTTGTTKSQNAITAPTTKKTLSASPSSPSISHQTITSTAKPGNSLVTTLTTDKSTVSADSLRSTSSISSLPISTVQGVTTMSNKKNTSPAPSISSHVSQQDKSLVSPTPSSATPAATSSAAQQQTNPSLNSSGVTTAASTVTSHVNLPGPSDAAKTSSPSTDPQGSQSLDPLTNTTGVLGAITTAGPSSQSATSSTSVTTQTHSFTSPGKELIVTTKPGSINASASPLNGSLSLTTSKTALTSSPGHTHGISEAATTTAPLSGQPDKSSHRATPPQATSTSWSSASALPSTSAQGDQGVSSSPGHQHPNTSLQNEVICKDQMQNNGSTMYLKEAKTCDEWRKASNNISFFESFCSTGQHTFNPSRERCTVTLMAPEPCSHQWAVSAVLHLPLDADKVLKQLKDNNKFEELGIANITDKMEREMIINDKFSTPLIITIVTLAGSLLLIAAIYGCCHQRFSQRKDQHIHPDLPGFDDGHVALIFNQRLTEELQTMENGYHDNPTLEVMETSSEMQEKKVNLNGELGDSWIVPLDTLMKEDLEEEEDTHL